jgi:signal peptidase I
MPILKKIYTILIDLFETIVIAGGIFVVIYAFLFRPYQVNGESMMPNFHHKEFILTNLITLRINDLKNGEVVVFKAPTDKDKDYIKRIIGIPGDTVMIQEGKVYVNGNVLDETEYLVPTLLTSNGNFMKPNQTVRVPDENYFVLGDNRNASSDSRDWGFVPQDDIIGKSMVVYWPPQEFKVVRGATYGQ